MSAKMEKVREMVDEYVRGHIPSVFLHSAALTEVEEWEQAMAQRMEVGRDMADRLEECWAERKAAEAEADRLRQLVIEAYPGNYPTNGWRKRAEDLDAWPKPVSAGDTT